MIGLLDRWSPESRVGVLVKELSVFGVVGALNLLLDLAVFQIAYVAMDFGPVTAKLIATLVSTTSAYLMHRYWSFAHRARTGVRREYVVFALINGLTLVLSLGMVSLVHNGFGVTGILILQVVNLFSIAVGTVIRYLAYKRWVFPPAVDSAPVESASVDSAAPDYEPAGSGRFSGGRANPSATVAASSR